MKSRAFALCLALSVSAVASAARAEMVTLMLSPSQPAAGLTNSVTATVNGSSYSYIIGALNWTVVSDVGGSTFAPTPLPSPAPTLQTWCIQFFQDVYLGSSYSYDVYPLSDSNGIAHTPPPAGVGSPVNDQGTVSLAAAQEIQGLFNTYSGLVNSNIAGAALQLAIWEIAYDHADTFPTHNGSTQFFTNGVVTASGLNSDGIAAVAQATTWLNNLTPDITSPTPTWALESTSSQDQMVGEVNLNPNLPPVPAPATLIAGILLMTGLGAWRAMRRVA